MVRQVRNPLEIQHSRAWFDPEVRLLRARDSCPRRRLSNCARRSQRAVLSVLAVLLIYRNESINVSSRLQVRCRHDELHFSSEFRKLNYILS